MKTLLLLRHAKSDWDDPRLRDIERPLAKRGERDAPRMGKALKEKGIKPDFVYCSPAMRARQTLERFTQAAGIDAEIQFEQNIYEAASAELIKLVRHLPNERQCVLMVGHNPGFETLLSRLIGESRVMPTAALGCVTFDIDRWEDVEDGQGKLKWFLIPKALD
ncbi:MAG: histidine phosphatase family protein [Acidobacteriota bacterium]